MSKALDDLEELNRATVAAASATLASGCRDDVAAAYAFASEMESWRVVLSGQPECALFDTAHGEFLVTLLNAVQGQYRNGFKGLRLVLELHLQGVLLSTDLLALREWLASSRDPNWAQITGAEGVFGHRVVRACVPAFARPAPRFQKEAVRAYRELSECIHGNVPVAIPLPEAIAFDEPALRLWLEKAGGVRRLVHFVLMLRYAQDLDDGARSRVEPMLMDVLGDVTEARGFFGGRTE